MGVKDDIRRKLEYVNRLESDKLVVVDRILRPIFNRIGAGVQREKYFIDSVYRPKNQYSTVCVLTDANKFNQFEVKAETKTEKEITTKIHGEISGRRSTRKKCMFLNH